MDPERFRAHSLAGIDQHGRIKAVMAAALRAVDPAAAVKRYLQRNGEHLSIGERKYHLGEIERVLVVGAGKAGVPMAEAVGEILGDRLSAGIVVVKEGYASTKGSRKTLLHGLKIVSAGHPLPDRRGVKAAEEISNLLQGTRAEDLVICLISGGGSALLTLPEEGISLEDLQELTSLLLASGANINEINALRKHLDRVKGGKLARLGAPAPLATLILSDVVGDPLDVIASGPTVPDGSTFQDAYRVLERYNLIEKVPDAILKHIRAGTQGEIAETPKPGDALFEQVNNVIVGSNLLAAQAAVQKAREVGLNALLLTTYLQGEASQAGRMLAAVARQVAATGQPLQRPVCIVVGGETTVTIRGEGHGGRNQELALGAVKDMAALKETALICLATDGGDGPTDAAGAVVSGDTLERAQQEGLDPHDFLGRNDSYHFFEPLGDLIKTGPTMTNVNDLAFIFSF